MPPILTRRIGRTLFGLLLALPGLALASGNYYKPVPLLPQYQKECGTCHVAYPAGLLQAGTWQRLMGGLKNHFGSNVALDAASAAQISDWLRANAGTNAKMMADPPEERLTRTNWFKLEHHDVQPAEWKLPAVQSAANCAACHANSAQGIFDERDAKIPR